MTHYLDIEEICKLHELIISRAKTKASIRDFALLHSAIERPRATYAGRELYPHIFAKTAAIMQSICQNHPFTDGNKRTAWATAVRFLWINNYHLKAQKNEAIDFMLKLDNEKPELKEIALWIKSRTSVL